MANAKKKKSKAKKIVIPIVVIAAVLAVVLFFILPRPGELQKSYRVSEAQKGDVELSVVGSGAAAAYETVAVIAPESGIAGTVAVAGGDIVGAGDTLVEILPDADAINTQIETLEENAEQQEINISKSKSAYSNYYIKASASGTIKALKAYKGEDAAVTTQTYGALCYISVTGKMQLTLPLPTGVTVAIGEPVDVTIGSAVEEGTITNTQQSAPTQTTVTVDIPTDVYDIGALASVAKKDATPVGTAALALKDGVAVTGNGLISKIYVSEGDAVQRGDKLFRTNTYELSKTIEGQEATLESTQEDIEELTEELNDITIVTATKTGIISSITAQTGSSIVQNQMVAQIAATDIMQAVVTIDELDIAKLKIGQQAEITLDALPDTVYTGTVSFISSIGTTLGGVTNYTVKVDLDAPKDILIGMSCSAEILVEKAADVLMIPTDAIMEQDGKTMVLLSTYQDALASGRQVDMQDYMKEVETGLANENYVQIVSGLALGDEVLIEIAETNSMLDAMRMYGPGRAGNDTADDDTETEDER